MSATLPKPAPATRRSDSVTAPATPARLQIAKEKILAAKAATTRQPPQSFDWNNPWVVGIATSVVAGLIGGILLFLFQRKLTDWFDRRKASKQLAEARRKKKADSSAIYQAYGPAALTQAQQHFRPHALQIPGNADAAEWQLLPASQTSLAYFIEEFLGVDQAEQRVYLVVGPTGIGKTTFLLNLYAQYAAQTKNRDAPDLLLGPLGSGYDDFKQRYLVPRLAENGGSQATILLLDGLDEYRYRHTAGGAGSASRAFEEEFSQFWVDFQERIAPRFQKVVITVREQFFQTWEEQNMQVSQQAATKLRLSPFDDEARQQYLAARYPRATDKAKHDGLLYLNSRLTLLGHTFLENPLLLTYLEYVWDEQRTRIKDGHYREETFLTGHNLVDVLVTKWLDREGKSKQLLPARLREFCQRLAYALVEAGPYSALSVAQLEALENQELGSSKSVLAAFGGRGDRSLLVRKGSLNTDDFRFEFAHERFLGYFLALYAEASPENAAQVPFDKHPYALRYFIGKRWRERLQTPLPAYQRPATGDNVVPLPVLRAWGEVLDGLVSDCSEATRAVFREGWEEILEKEVPEWLKSFQQLKGLTITSANLAFVDDELGRIGFGYLRNFVIGVDLSNENLANNELLYLKGAQNASWLILNSTNLPAAQLVAFTHSAQHLTELGLSGIDLRSDYPAWFAQTERLTQLGLNSTNLPAVQLVAFTRNAQHLTRLALNGIDLRINYPAWFAQTERLTLLSLRDTHLPAAQLAVFARNAQYFQKLVLDGIDLCHDYPAWFAQTEHLTELGLNETHLPAAQLAVFVRSAQHLTALRLYGIDLRNDCPAWFAQTERLTELDLCNTHLPTAQLATLARSAQHLTSVGLYGIDLRHDCPAWFIHTEHLTELILSATYLPAAQLAAFARSARHFKKLALDGIDLRHDCPAWFAQTQRLTHLSLNNTSLSSYTLALFNTSAPFLVFLDVSENPDITEASFTCFGEHQERLIALAEKNGWSRTGPNLPSPAADTTDDGIPSAESVLPPRPATSA